MIYLNTYDLNNQHIIKMIDQLCHTIQSYISTKFFLRLKLYKNYGFENHIKLCYNNVINKEHAIKYQNTKYLEHIINRKLVKFKPIDLDYACFYNCIKSLLFFFKLRIFPKKNAMDLACEENNIKVCKILHKLNYCCSSKAIDTVFENGYYEMVKFLYSISTIFENRHLVIACSNGDFKIVKFLITKCDIEVSELAIEASIENYHEKIENYLQEICNKNGLFIENKYGYTSDDFIEYTDEDVSMY